MKYKIEIWRYGSEVDKYESDKIEEIVSWYRCKWQDCFENGGCTFYIYEYGRELSFDEEDEIGIW